MRGRKEKEADRQRQTDDSGNGFEDGGGKTQRKTQREYGQVDDRARAK